MLLLVILFYLSDPKSKINQWLSIGGVLFWCGIVKEAILHQLIPWMHVTFELSGLDVAFAPAHSVMTWVIYALALPTMTVAGLYYGYVDKTHARHLRLFQILIFVPGFFLLFFFAPVRFREYQLTSSVFWVVYTIYNFGFAFMLTFLAARGAHIERKSNAKNQKNQKSHVARILLPPLYYWLVSIFIVHLVDALELFELSEHYQVWRFNVFIVLICIAIFIISAFRDGFMGLKLVSQKTDWDTNMSNINENAASAIHVLNTHTINMKSSIYLLEVYNSTDEPSREKISDRLNILSNSISYLENYFERIRHHSQSIHLKDEGWFKVAELLRDAETSVNSVYNGVIASIGVSEDDLLYCDRIHMTEVFVNIIKNAAEAMGEKGVVEIDGFHNKKQLKSNYQLLFKDHGGGIDSDRVGDIFKPYSSSKNKEKNFGLGLSYCRNVVIAHGGKIFVAESIRGEGTTIEIEFPLRRAKGGDTTGAN